MPTTAGAQHAYASGSSSLELSGAFAGQLVAIDGGDATADVVNETLGSDSVVHKHLGAVRYTDIELECGAAMERSFFDWIQDTMSHRFAAKSGAISYRDHGYQGHARLEFSNALLSSVGFPALDAAAARDTATMTVRLTPEYTRRQPGSGLAAPVGSKGQKQWTRAHFRLQIDGLDCVGVTKVESLVVTAVAAEVPAGEFRDYEKVVSHLEVSDLVLTVAGSRAATFHAWHDDFVIKGLNGSQYEKNGTLEFLSANMQDVLLTLQLRNLGIFKLAPVKATLGETSAIAGFRASMYCEAITLGASSVAPAIAPTSSPMSAPPAAASAMAPTSSPGAAPGAAPAAASSAMAPTSSTGAAPGAAPAGAAAAIEHPMGTIVAGRFPRELRRDTPEVPMAISESGGPTDAPATHPGEAGELAVVAGSAGVGSLSTAASGYWAPWESLGGVLSASPDVCSWAPGRLDVFAQGTDYALLHRWYEGGWSGWESLGGVNNAPAAVSWGHGRIDLFYCRVDGAVAHRWYDGGWSGWESLGPGASWTLGPMVGGPAVSSWAPGRLDVFAADYYGALCYKWYDGAWSGWESLGGILTSDPAAVSWGHGRIDVFARGGDDVLYHKWYDGGRWFDWEWFGGLSVAFGAAPAVASWGSGRLDVFARGTDNALWHRRYDGDWSGWESLGGELKSGPAAVSWSHGRIDVFARGKDDALWHRWYGQEESLARSG